MHPWNSHQAPEDGLPPQDIRFVELRVEPWPEGRRVRVHMQLTPFLERPNIRAVITNANAEEVASIDIIESMDARMTFTMHIRGDEIKGAYTLTASLNYPELGTVSQDRVVFETSESST